MGQQRVIPNVSVYFVMDSVRKLLDTHSYVTKLRVFPQISAESF